MGRATRWLKGLLGGRKDSRESSRDSNGFSAGIGGSDERREKKRWSFKSGRDSADNVAEPPQVPRSASADNAAWLRPLPLYLETEREQNKHAIAVAAATAAAADAAVAAAQAAVAVVRLTSQGRGTIERIAAVRIQTTFRGYLARKALRALKALVKLQALVRGYLVRRQAAATLHSMQALIRAQAAVRAHKSRAPPSHDHRFLPEICPRKSLERFDETRSEQMPSFHSRRLSGNLDSMNNGYDRSPKIVEIDTCRPTKSKSSRSRTSPSLMDSAEDTTISSPLRPCQIPAPARISIPDCRNFQDYDWCLTGDRCRYSSTAQSTPRYMNSACIAPATPAKSVCAADGVFRRYLNLPNCPNYMTSTQSFEAKVRSQSAPKQRPEMGLRKRLPLSEVLVESRASLSGVGMQRSCTRAQEVAAFNFKSTVVDRLDRSLELGRESERDLYLQKKW